MVFDINDVAKEFKNMIDWMLMDKYGKEMKDWIQWIKDNKTNLATEPDYPNALKLLLDIIINQAWWRGKRKGFDTEINSFIAKHGTKFRTSTMAKTDLDALVEKFALKPIKAKKEKIHKLLTDYSTIQEFTEKLYDLAKKWESDILGEKGRDNYLRDFGYLDRIPIDKHEMRFIIRSGIYHSCSDISKSDHFQKKHLHHALTQFCSKYLGGKFVEGIDLGYAPGIVDIFIWTYCGKEKYNICGSTPKCYECNLNRVCLYALINSQ